MTTLTAIHGDRDESLVEAVARRLRVLLAENQIKQVELADAIGMSKPAFSKRVRGQQALTLEDIDAIAAVLGIRRDALLTDNVSMLPPTPDGGDQGASYRDRTDDLPLTRSPADLPEGAIICPFPVRREHDDDQVAA